MMTDYDIELDAQETAWATRLGFDSAAEYHAASDEAFAESVREWDDE